MKKIMASEATVALSGAVAAVNFAAAYSYFAVRNDGDGVVYASTSNALCTAGADGVLSIPAGGSVVISAAIGRAVADGSVLYLNGSGSVSVVGQYDRINPFKANEKGGETSAITPEKLGYISGAKLFFDGIYNYSQNHTENGAYWIDMINNAVMRRYAVDTGNTLINTNHYVKATGSNSALRIPNTFDSDNFTVEMFLEITAIDTSENDIVDNFNRAGFGIYTMDGKIYANIFSSATNSYLDITVNSYALNTKYHLAVTYNGETFILYVNGVMSGSVALSLLDYKKSTVIPYIGCVGGGGSYYAGGSYKIYRFAHYVRALSAAEIAQNCNADIYRFSD